MTRRGLMRLLSLTVLPFSAFYWLAQFSSIQSAALSVACWLLSYRLEWLRQYLAARELFEPFYVKVVPKWAEIVRDYKIVNEEDLCELMKRAEAHPERYRVLTSGFLFCVLTPKPG